MNDVEIGRDGYTLPAKKVSYSISFVIPAFNEEDNITEVIERSVRILEKITGRFEVIVVDDSSTDQTGERISACVAQWRRPESGGNLEEGFPGWGLSKQPSQHPEAAETAAGRRKTLYVSDSYSRIQNSSSSTVIISPA